VVDKEAAEAIVGTATETSALTAYFAGTAIVMLVRQLEKSGAVPVGSMEKSIKEFLFAAPTSYPKRLDLAFLGELLKQLERSKNWPGDEPSRKPYTLH